MSKWISRSDNGIRYRYDPAICTPHSAITFTEDFFTASEFKSRFEHSWVNTCNTCRRNVCATDINHTPSFTVWSGVFLLLGSLLSKLWVTHCQKMQTPIPPLGVHFNAIFSFRNHCPVIPWSEFIFPCVFILCTIRQMWIDPTWIQDEVCALQISSGFKGARPSPSHVLKIEKDGWRSAP